MYRKSGIAALVLAAVVLSGCNGGSDISTGSSLSTSSEVENISDNSTNSTISSSSSETENSTNSTDISTVSSSSEVENSSDISTSSTITENPDPETGIFIANHDPKNALKFIFDGLRVTITGKIPHEGIDYVTTDRGAATKITTNDDEFTITIDFYSGADGYTSVRVYEKSGSRALYRLRFADGKVCLPDCTDVAEKNMKVVEKAVEQQLEQVSEYVAAGSDKQVVREVLLQVKVLSNEICEGISDDYDKLRAIENWAANNIYYDYPAFDKGVPPETLSLKYILENKSTVCGGYSNIVAALAAAQDIMIYNVHGTGAEGVFCLAEKPGEAVHEFNYAVIDGRVIWIDADMDSRCYYRRNGVYESGKSIHKFFDADISLISQTHRAKYAEHRDYFALLDD